MAEDFLPPVVATLAADITAYVAGLARAGTEMQAFVGRQIAEIARLDAAFASSGKAAVEAAEREAAAAKTASAEITAATERIERSVTGTAIAADRAALQWERDFAKMKAETAGLARDMQAAQVKVDAAWADMAAAEEASTAKASAGVGKGAGMIALAVGAIGVAAVDMAAHYEKSTTRLVTSAGETQESIDKVRKGMLTMAGEVGVSAQQLSVDIYKIGSAGYHAEAGLGVLKAAEQGAKAEGAEGAKVADALSSALRDYYPHATDAAEVTRLAADTMSKFIGATSSGKMTFDDLAGSLNSILPVASAAKISMDDVLGVLASMTVHGISAQQATQNMADAIRHLQAPTQAMSKAMATLGIDSTDVAAKLGQRGLSGTMEYLSQAVRNHMNTELPGSTKVILELGDALSKSSPKVQELGQKVLDGSMSMKEFANAAKDLDPLSAKQVQSFATLAGSYHQLGNESISGAEVMQSYGGMLQKVMGDATGLKVALMTTGENAQYTSDAIKNIAGSTADASGNVKGWSEVQGTLSQKLSEAKAALESLMIQLGTLLLPVVTRVADAFATFSRYLADHEGVAKGVAIVLGGVLLAAVITITAAFWAWAAAVWANPVTWIIAGIVVAIGVIVAWGIAIYNIITHWDAVVDALKEGWEKVKHALGAAGDWLFAVLIQPWIDGWNLLKTATGHAVDAVVRFFSELPGKVGGALLSFIQAVGRFFSELPGMILRALAALPGFLWNLFVDALAFAAKAIGFGLGLLLGIVVGIPVMIIKGLINLGFMLWDWAVDAWNSAKQATISAIASLALFVAAAPGRIIEAVSAFGSMLAGWASDAWEWAKRTTASVIVGILESCRTFPGRAIEAVSAFGSMLAGWASDAWEWMKRTAIDVANGLVDWVSGLPGRIVSALGDLGGLLVGAGRKIIEGFLSGLKAAFSGVQDFVSGIGGWISSHKGPLDYDATLLVVNGATIMGGLLSGLRSQEPVIKSYLKDLSATLGTTVPMGVTATAGGAWSSAAGTGPSSAVMPVAQPALTTGGVTNIYVTVQGNAVTTRKLADELQAIILQKTLRNDRNGLSVRRV